MSVAEYTAPARAAAACALGMIAWQVAAKAVRDTLFLEQFDITLLPLMVVGSSLTAVATVPLVGRAMSVLGPARFVPAAFGASAVSFLALGGVYLVLPGVSAVLIYLQIAVLGAVVVSGFWSVVNERFDPRAGKRHFATIVGAANAGGIVGGLAAERVGAWFSVEALLPLLAAVHLFCAVAITRVGVPAHADASLDTDEQSGQSAFRLLAGRPYLRRLAVLVVLLAVSSGLIDYVFKAEAVARFEDAALLRFFAWFYTGVGVLTLVLQQVLARPLLQRAGLGRTAAVLPGMVAMGGVVALFVPGIAAPVGVRAGDGALRSSVFASAYELLYVPLPTHEKRKVKPLIDVGFNRLGDAVGGMVVSGLLLVGALWKPAMLGVAVVLSICAVAVTFLLERGYVGALERSLLYQADRLDPLSDVNDGGTLSVLRRTFGSLDLGARDPQLSQVLLSGMFRAAPQQRDPTPAPAPARLPDDAVVRRVSELRSRDPNRVTAALSGPISPEFVGHVIPLLAWNEVASAALEALCHALPACTGQLVDALMDEDEAFSIRRRVPRALGKAGDHRAVEGLLAGLDDRRFEVRYRCGRGLAALNARIEGLVVPHKRIEAVILAETETEKSVWASRKLLDEVEEVGDDRVDAFLRERVNRSLEHVFTLLSLSLPPAPLQVAFRGLHTDDAQLRGTALEYLEAVLPDALRERLFPLLDDRPHKRRKGVTPEAALDELLASHASIQLNLEELRQREHEG